MINLEISDFVLHVRILKNLMHLDKTSQDLTDRLSLLVAVGDTRVDASFASHFEEPVGVRNKHPTGLRRKGQHIRIRPSA